MRKPKVALYAGSFDPVTLGHIWMIEQGTNLFDKLVVAVGLNPDKQPYFSVEERIDLLKESTTKFSNVSIKQYWDRKFLIKYAEEIGAQYILRAGRSISCGGSGIRKTTNTRKRGGTSTAT